jgi:uncharacterized protein YjiS (DUF1127 family)
MCVFYQFPMQEPDASQRIGRSIGGFIRRVARGALRAMERSQQRRALLGLSDHQLRDIGLTREQVLAHSPEPIQQTETQTPAQSQGKSSHDLRAA